jgi:hypothetical protein
VINCLASISSVIGPGRPEDRRMKIDASHPALGLARELFSAEGWEITDALGRDDEAVVVELRRSGRRLLFVSVARDGAWHRPGLATDTHEPVPEQRKPTTTIGSELDPVGVQGSGWPDPDGTPPETAWMTINGFAAADVESITVSTGIDHHEATLGPDGSVLTLVRNRRHQPLRVHLHLTTGETREASV